MLCVDISHRLKPSSPTSFSTYATSLVLLPVCTLGYTLTNKRLKRRDTRGDGPLSRDLPFRVYFRGNNMHGGALYFQLPVTYLLEIVGDCPTSHGRSWNPAKGRLKQHFHLQTALPMLSFIKSFQESCEDYFHPLYRITNSNTIHGLLLPTT